LINFFRSRHSTQQNILELLHKEGPIETDDLSKRLQVKKADMDSGNEQKEIMKDVARIEAEGRGFWLINLFGEKTFIEGTIQTINLVGGQLVMTEGHKLT